MRTSTKIILSSSLVTFLVVLIFGLFSLNRIYETELREEYDNLNKCMQTFHSLFKHVDHDFRLVGGQLLVGDHVVNDNFEVPDKVQEIFGVVATVFMGDVRVSTNVLDQEGKRALGTRLVGPAYTAIFKEGRAYQGEAPILGHSYLTVYDPIRDENGAVIGALFVGVKKSSFLQNVNQIRLPIIVMLMILLSGLAIVTFLLLRVTRKLESQEANNLSFLRTLMETIPSPIFYKDRAGRYLGFNKAYESYVGISQDQLIGKTPSEIWPPDLAEKYQQQDQALFENPGIQKYEGAMVIADGTRHDVIFHKATFCSQSGAVAGLVGIILDITEAKAASIQIQNAYQQVLDIIEFLPDATFVLDKDKRVIAWNRAMEEMTGVAKDEIMGKGDYAYSESFYGFRRPTLIDMIGKGDDELYAHYDYVQKTGETIFAQVTLPALGNQDTRFVSSTASPLFDRQGNQVGSIQSIRDLTENRRVYIEKSRLQAQLQHSQMMQSVMVQLGHDLKTPLTPLITLLPLISEKLADAKLKRMAEICCENARLIAGLTDKTLNFASLSSILASAEREEIALAPALDALLASRFGDVSCDNAIAPDVVVQADPNQLNELLANLISNAARYSTAGGIVRITAEQTDSSVTVAVRDDGIGLVPQHLERIFDEFFKVDESRHDLANSGLGLSICKRIVLNHRGKIWAESPGIGQGTTILFRLPKNSIEYSI